MSARERDRGARAERAVVGLDLSITATGVALADGSLLTVGPPAKLGDRRLTAIVDRLEHAPAMVYAADLVVIEGPVVRSSAAVVIGMVHGAVRSMLLGYGTPYAIVPPATLKKYATGKGNTDKTAMALALYKRTGLELADDNQVDAWWLRAAGLHHLGCPIVDVPQAQADALAKVEWPTLDVIDGAA